MAFAPNKRKTLESAQKFAQKGAHDKALKEYEKLLQADPKDTNVRLKIGDLYLKKSDAVHAIEAYAVVAEQFSSSGFDAKAVAIYKQILRVDEGCLEARIQLGDHFQRMGLLSDALREFQAATKLCQERDLKREAFDLLKRVASLDPSNIPNRLNLADLMRRQGMEGDARQEYTALLDEVSRLTDSDLIERVASETLRAFPDHKEALQALVRMKIACGETRAAIEFLRESLPNFPTDIELRESLVLAFEADGDKEGLAATYREIAELYKQRGDSEKARDILQRFVPMESFGVVDADDDTPTSSILLTEASEEADAADGTSGAADGTSGGDARPSFTPPSSPQTERKLRLALPPPEPPDGMQSAADQSPADLLAEARVAFEFGDPHTGERIARRVIELDPSCSEAKLMLSEGAAEPFEVDPMGETQIAEAPLDDSIPDIELILEDEDDCDDTFASIDPPTVLADVTREIELGTDEAAEIEPDEIDSGEPESMTALDLAIGDDADGDDDFNIEESLGEGDFFREQGMLDEAARVFRGILEHAPEHPEALARLSELEPAVETPESDPDIEDVVAEASEPALKLQPTVPAEDTQPPADDYAIEFDAESLSPEEPVTTAGDPETVDERELDPEPQSVEQIERVAAPEVEAIAPEPEAEPDPEPEPETKTETETTDPFSDLRAEAEEAVAAVSPSSEDDGFDLAAGLDAAAPAGGDTGAFEDVFAAFKKGIQEQVGEDESETHYDLAIAYKQMGLVEDAVRELDLVQRAGARPVETLSLLAACKLELSQPDQAAAHLEEALGLAFDGAEQAVSLRYDLGEALLAGGDSGAARDAFEKVAAADPNFRDVKERIAGLA